MKDQIQGWKFPPSFNKYTLSAALTTGAEDIAESVYLIIQTRLGERVMRNNFGTTVQDQVFEPFNENSKTYLTVMLTESLETNEPRITVVQVDINQPEPTLGRVNITVEYSIDQTGEVTAVTVPVNKPDDLF